MRPADRAILLASLVLLFALAWWQAVVVAGRVEQATCWGADRDIATLGLEFDLAIEAGIYTDAEATAALERQAAILAQQCPGYRSPSLAGAP